MPLVHHTLQDGPIEVELVDLGAAIDVIRLDGDDITLRLDTDDERADPARNRYLGVTVGPFANRIVLDDGSVQLHGGPDGWPWQRWNLTEATTTAARFELDDRATVEYQLADGTLDVVLEARVDVATPVSMTNHTYWAIGGAGDPHNDDLVLTVDAASVVPIDERLIPTGPPVDAEGAFDLRTGGRLGSRIGFPLASGYDHCFLIDGWDGPFRFRRHARLEHPPTGRALEVWSDHPGLQVYTGGTSRGVEGVALEPQHVPNAPHLPWAPDAVLQPGETYRHHVAFRLTVEPGTQETDA